MTGAPVQSQTPLPAHVVPRTLVRFEQGFAVFVLAAMMVLPVTAVLLRWITGDVMASANVWVQTLNLWLAFVGATIAARAGRHLSLSTGELLNLSPRNKELLGGFTTAVAVAVTAWLAYASMDLVRAEMGGSRELPGGLPHWVAQLVMPAGFALMAVRLAWKGSPTWRGRLVALIAVIGCGLLSFVPEGERAWVAWVCCSALAVAVALGAPIFTAMGGTAMVLFFTQDFPSPISAVPADTVTLIQDPSLPAIPLFTLAGYLLAEGGASRRLVELFRSWFAWLPGGIAAAAILVCAFFTTFTGASGVTILALGGLLLPILLKVGYTERFSVGLLAASGSIGLLFPPSLPVILYGVRAQVPINELFISGIVPGAVLVLLLIGYGVYRALVDKVTREPFERGEAFRAAWEAKWELLLPVLVLVGIFGGFLTIFEASAFTAAYAFLTEVVIHRDLKLKGDVPRVFLECATLMGGVLIILGLALGFTNYLVDAGIAEIVTDWASSKVGNKILFILALNILLLIVGCLMDIYSAIMVVVPLITPLAAHFGIHPMHLGILFLANLELGYLTPPVGMNLFLASYRFDKPLTEVYRYAMPFLGILLVGVLLIAYTPALTLWHTDASAAPDAMPSFDELEGNGGDGAAPALPLGNIDLDALLNEVEEPDGGEGEPDAGEPEGDDAQPDAPEPGGGEQQQDAAEPDAAEPSGAGASPGDPGPAEPEGGGEP